MPSLPVTEESRVSKVRWRARPSFPAAWVARIGNRCGSLIPCSWEARKEAWKWSSRSAAPLLPVTQTIHSGRTPLFFGPRGGSRRIRVRSLWADLCPETAQTLEQNFCSWAMCFPRKPSFRSNGRFIRAENRISLLQDPLFRLHPGIYHVAILLTEKCIPKYL